MPLATAEITEIINDEVLPDAKRAWSQNNMLQQKLNGLVTKTWMPTGVDGEYRDLFRKSRSPWLKFGAACIAQGLIIDGHSNDEVWEKAWEGTGMGGRQSALNEQVVGYGYGYLVSLPSDIKGGVFMRPLSVLNTYSVKEDPWDEQPKYVIHKSKDHQDVKKRVHKFFDDEAVYEIFGDVTRPDRVLTTPHGVGMNPVTLIQSQFAMDGLPASLVEGAFGVYQRVVDATFTLQMVQRYGAFPQKWQTGGVMAVDENGNAMIRPSVDSILHNEDELVKFGNFQAADIDKVVAAKDAHLQDLAAMLQIPPHYFLGKVVNLSSDAVAAIETGYHRRNNLLKDSMAEGYEQALRVASAVLELPDAAQDMDASVHWAATEVWSLGVVADAAVKLNSIGAPREKLFQMVPGWDAQDAQESKNVAIIREREDTASQARDTASQVTVSPQTTPTRDSGGDAVTTTA